MEDTIEKLKHLIANELDIRIKQEEINADSPLLEDGLKLDSLAVVELIALIEANFGMQFDEEDLNMDSFASLRCLAQVIGAHQARSFSTVENAGATGLRLPLSNGAVAAS